MYNSLKAGARTIDAPSLLSLSESAWRPAEGCARFASLKRTQPRLLSRLASSSSRWSKRRDVSRHSSRIRRDKERKKHPRTDVSSSPHGAEVVKAVPKLDQSSRIIVGARPDLDCPTQRFKPRLADVICRKTALLAQYAFYIWLGIS